MPNHVQNIIDFDCSDERLQEIKAAVAFSNNEDADIGTLDFNKLIPMPEDLNIESGSVTEHGIEIYLTEVNPNTRQYNLHKMPIEIFDAVCYKLDRGSTWRCYNSALTDEKIAEYTRWQTLEGLEKIGEQAVNNLIKYGATTWYSWCIDNWGTKWNSYDTWEDYRGFAFNTAWSAPHPVIGALAKKFPDVSFTHKWADEDIGSNCGVRKYTNGECVEEWLPSTYGEAVKFACDIWGCDVADYLDNDNDEQ